MAKVFGSSGLMAFALFICAGCASAPAQKPVTTEYKPTSAYNPNAVWHSYEPGNEPEDQLDRIYNDEAVKAVIPLVPSHCQKYPNSLSDRKYFALTQKVYAMEMAARELFPKSRPAWVDEEIKKAALISCMKKD